MTCAHTHVDGLLRERQSVIDPCSNAVRGAIEMHGEGRGGRAGWLTVIVAHVRARRGRSVFRLMVFVLSLVDHGRSVQCRCGLEPQAAGYELKWGKGACHVLVRRWRAARRCSSRPGGPTGLVKASKTTNQAGQASYGHMGGPTSRNRGLLSRFDVEGWVTVEYEHDRMESRHMNVQPRQYDSGTPLATLAVTKAEALIA